LLFHLLPLCSLLLFFPWEKSLSGLHQSGLSGQTAISPYESPPLTIAADWFLRAHQTSPSLDSSQKKVPSKLRDLCGEVGRRNLVCVKDLWKLQDEVISPPTPYGQGELLNS